MNRCLAPLLGVVTLLVCVGPARAQLRIVTYNTATGQSDNPNPGQQGGQLARPGISTILAAIGAEAVGGIARPIDVLMLQEQYTLATSTQSFVDVLNDLYDPVNRTMYARGTVQASTSSPVADGGRPAVVYNTQTVTLLPTSNPTLGEVRVGTASGTSQARQAMRYRFRPVGYDSSADFWTFVSHYKAGSTATDQMRRQSEATSIRLSADNSLAQGSHIIYAGDYNVQSSGEQSFQTLLAPGNGQAFDPLDLSGDYGNPATFVSWTSNSAYRAIHTQSPATSLQFPGQTLGGMDDRFDFQLLSGELLDDEGMSYISGSYRAFGNNGTHACCNSAITSGSGATAAVRTALMQASDHLPVVADYQLPARMGVQVAMIPSFVELGASVPISLTVTNTAPTLLVAGADELDYAVSVIGSLFGGAAGTDAATGGGNAHQIMLDTSVLGVRSGMLNLNSTSQQAANAVFSMPINFTVIASFLAADFNNDGAVNGVDLSTWESNFGLGMSAVKTQGDANLDGRVDGEDFLVWQRQVGQPPAGVAAGTIVPEPATVLPMLLAACAAIAAGRRHI